jgi:hypothetical protein
VPPLYAIPIVYLYLDRLQNRLSSGRRHQVLSQDAYPTTTTERALVLELVGNRQVIRMPLARIASASSAAGPRVALPLPSRTNSTVPRSGSPWPFGISTRPAGIRPWGTIVMPSPASAAVRKPLKLPLVQTIRQEQPDRSSSASAISRVMLGDE